MSFFARYIQDYFYQYPLSSLLILGATALLMGIFTLRQSYQWWKHIQNKRKLVQQIQQHFSQNKKS